MSDASPREWRFYVDDMIGFAENIHAYTKGLNQAGFTASGLNYDATVRNLDCQDQAGAHSLDTERWSRGSILNVARIGRFSSDHAIREYAEDIWKVQPVPVAG
jgi:glucan phosphorylase